MKRLSILLLIVMVSLSSCAINEEKEIAEESKPSSFQPEPLDDEWSNWLIGKWQATGGHSDFLGDESESVGESNEEGEAGFKDRGNSVFIVRRQQDGSWKVARLIVARSIPNSDLPPASSK